MPNFPLDHLDDLLTPVSRGCEGSFALSNVFFASEFPESDTSGNCEKPDTSPSDAPTSNGAVTKVVTERCPICGGSGNNYHFANRRCSACGGSGKASTRAAAPRSPSLVQEQYEAAWHIKQRLR